MRNVNSSAGIRYEVHETPVDLARLVNLVARQRRIWIDTETADWKTRQPRLSLVQLRLEDGSIHVVDVLSAEMATAFQQSFVPKVIAAPHIEKWAHYARFERRIFEASFGADRVEGLNCTFNLARGVPYHRLPLRSLRLSTLVHHFYGQAIDKTFQKADWGHRPLTTQELDYAAWDPEWCYRVHQRLRPLEPSWDPRSDDPEEIQSRYVKILPAERDADRSRTAIWDAIKEFMVARGRKQFADFFLQTRTIRKVPIRAFAAAAAEVDPMHAAEFAISVSTALMELLRPGGEDALRSTGREASGTRFLGPLAPRAKSKPSYTVDPDDPEGVASDYEKAWHKHRKLESECQELKGRMRAWMEHRAVKDWGEFRIRDYAPRLMTDVRTVAEWLRDDEDLLASLPARFLSVLTPRAMEPLRQYEEEAQVLRWRPDRSGEPGEIPQSRDWYGTDEVE